MGIRIRAARFRSDFIVPASFGFSQFRFGVSAFRQQPARAGMRQMGGYPQQFLKRRKGPCGDNVESAGYVLDSLCGDRGVGERQFLDNGG